MSKNMVVILSIAMAVTNILKVAMGRRGWKEGLEDGASSEPSAEKAETAATKKTGKETEPNEGEDELGNTEADQKKLQEIKKDGKELIKLQDKIIDGFNEIEPHMQEAEKLSDKIQKTAETLQNKV
jgi:hypothetical protein